MLALHARPCLRGTHTALAKHAAGASETCSRSEQLTAWHRRPTGPLLQPLGRACRASRCQRCHPGAWHAIPRSGCADDACASPLRHSGHASGRATHRMRSADCSFIPSMCVWPCLMARCLERARASSSDSLTFFTGGGAGWLPSLACLRFWERSVRPMFSTCAHTSRAAATTGVRMECTWRAGQGCGQSPAAGVPVLCRCHCDADLGLLLSCRPSCAPAA